LRTKEYIKALAVKTIESEAISIKNLAKLVDDDFYKCVDLIYNSSGRVIITGIGKSANIANKIVATLNSTGTPAIFMHAADAIHGDLGIIRNDDVVICISKSGNTPEIKVLVPLIKKFGNKLIALVSNIESYLSKNADIVLNASVEKEACPINLAPTTSTTAQLVVGDALAICLLDHRGFTIDDFAKFHPGGILGKKLYSKVEDLFVDFNDAPKVYIDDTLKTVILEISSKRFGATVVINKNNEILGVITDGDLRRMLENNTSFNSLTAIDIMTKNPKVIKKEDLAINAFNLMKNNNITQLIVSDGNKYIGMVHLHDIIKEGIV